MYRFIRGQVCNSNDLTRERIWRGVARKIAEWHALLPVVSVSASAVVDGVDTPSDPFAREPSHPKPSAEAINHITPSKAAPNVWTVIQKWIFALPTASEDERKRKNDLQKELERTVADLADMPSLGKDGVSLLAFNVLLSSRRLQS